MRQYIKKITILLTLLLSISVIAGCSQKADTLDPEITTQLTGVCNNYVTQIAALDDASIESYQIQAEASGDSVTAAGFASWLDGKKECGELMGIDSTEVAKSDDGYMVTMGYTGSTRNGVINMGVSEDMTQLTSFTVTPIHSMGEKMTDAALNMMMGMGTVFVVLVLISFIISLFKFINVWEKKAKDKLAKKDADTTTPAPIATAQAGTANQVDDAQLVAVISAAIAAYSGTSSDGLVVRSIKRVSKSNWKKA